MSHVYKYKLRETKKCRHYLEQFANDEVSGGCTNGIV